MKFLGLSLSILLASCVGLAQAKCRPDIGDVLKKQHIPKRPMEMAVGCCFYPFLEKTFGGVKYTIAFERETREVIYLSTSDKDFQTESGLRVGDSIQVSFKRTVSSGFTIYAPETSDGWFPVVGYSLSLPDEELNPFESANPDEVLMLKILSFGKGMWGKQRAR